MAHGGSSWTKGSKERTSWKAGTLDKTTSSDNQSSQEQWNQDHAQEQGGQVDRDDNGFP